MRALDEFDLRERFPDAEFFGPIIAIGDIEKLSIRGNVRIDGFCKLEIGRGLEIGAGTHVASFCHLNIGGGLTAIGEEVGIASGAKVVSRSNTPRGAMSASTKTPDEVLLIDWMVLIGRHGFLGAGSIVMPGGVVEEGAVLGANSLLPPGKRCEAWWTYVGSPARKSSERTWRP